MLVQGNTIYDTGGAECIGGIYAAALQGLSDAYAVIEGNTIHRVSGDNTYWNGEQHGVYLENGTTYARAIRNYVTYATSGLHCNSFTVGNEYISNIVDHCTNGITDHGASSTGADNSDTKYYFNTLSNVNHGIGLSRPAAVTSFNNDIKVKNNVFTSDGSSESAGCYIGYALDDISGSVDEDYNVYYNFTYVKKRSGGTLQQALGANNLTSSPFLMALSRPAAPSSAYHAGTFMGHYRDFLGRPYHIPPTIGGYEFTSGFPAQPRTAR
jgi:hypothetical protein